MIHRTTKRVGAQTTNVVTPKNTAAKSAKNNPTQPTASFAPRTTKRVLVTKVQRGFTGTDAVKKNIQGLGDVMVSPNDPTMVRVLMQKPRGYRPGPLSMGDYGSAFGRKGRMVGEQRVGGQTYGVFEIPYYNLLSIGLYDFPVADPQAIARHNLDVCATNGLFVDRPVSVIEPVEKLPEVPGLFQDIARESHGVAESFEKHGYKGAGIRVAVVDTGYAQGVHDEIFGNRVKKLWTAFNDPIDRHGHGTHCAGSILGGPRANTNWRGMAPEADLYAYKTLDDNGSGSINSILAGINEAIADDVDVISMSLGGSAQSADLKDPMIMALVEGARKGIISCVAAGNSGDSPISTPGHGFIVLSVGAVDTNNTKGRDDDRSASFSSRGGDPYYVPEKGGYGKEWEGYSQVNHNEDGKPNLAAAGVKILSTTAKGWERWSGTSMATPQVAGIIALAVEYVKKNAPKMTKLERYKLVVNSVLESCVPVSDGNGGNEKPNVVGQGFLDAAKLYDVLEKAVGKKGEKQAA